MGQKTIKELKTSQSKPKSNKKVAFFDHSTSDGMTRLYGVIFKPSTIAPAIKKKLRSDAQIKA